MSFHPSHYLGRPLPELVAGLADQEPERLLNAWEGRVDLHAAEALECPPTIDAVTSRPGTLFVSPANTYLPPDHPDVDVPDVVLETYLGGGGQGWVYAGRIISTGMIVAVKVLRKEYIQSQGSAAREALVCARLRHRNILRVFCARPAGAYWVVLMELVQGPELGAAPLNRPQLRACFAQLADALLTLREHRVVHCDVKPANILLRDREQSPVLVDFGVAVDLRAVDRKTFKVAGTPFYMPPEAFGAAPPDPAWDAYALGVTAAAVLVGQVRGFASLTTLKEAKLSGEFDRTVHEMLRGIDEPELRTWVTALIGKNPADRTGALQLARRWTAA